MDSQNNSGTTAPPEGTDLFFPNGLRNVRYGEVLLLSADDAGSFHAEVWNTLGFGDCPQDQWDALDPVAIAAERGALGAIMNGPRFWTLDTIVSLDADGPRATTTFGDITMFRAASLELGSTLPDQSPFTDRGVARETIFRWRAGSEVHALYDPTGRHYVMQSYCHIKDPTLTIDCLAALGPELGLPDGWRYETRVLDADVDALSENGIATITQDALQNTYQYLGGA